MRSKLKESKRKYWLRFWSKELKEVADNLKITYKNSFKLKNRKIELNRKERLE
jgi:hypothetical protein